MSRNHKTIPRSEYPRPQFARALWFNLNGEWEFAFDDHDQGCKQDGRMVAPSRTNRRAVRLPN